MRGTTMDSLTVEYVEKSASTHIVEKTKGLSLIDVDIVPSTEISRYFYV